MWFPKKAVVVSCFLVFGCVPAGEERSNRAWSPGISVITDPETGCEYLVSNLGGITPRMEFQNSFAGSYGKYKGCRS